MAFPRAVFGGLFAVMVGLACGGKTVGDDPSPDNCVNADIGESDEACTSDSDCIVALSGDVCGSECAVCPMVMNQAAATRTTAQLATVSYGNCGCPATPAGARCVAGQCAAIIDAGAPSSTDAGTDARPDTGLVDVDCAEVATTLCTLASQCTGNGPGGICMVIDDSQTVCVSSIIDCQALFASCASSTTTGVLPEPAECDEQLGAGVCTQSGADTEFTLPVSCATCAGNSAFPTCIRRADAG